MGSQASSDGRRIVKPALTTPRARPRPKRCRAPPLADRQPTGNQLTANAVPTLPGEGKGPAPRARLERAAYRL